MRLLKIFLVFLIMAGLLEAMDTKKDAVSKSGDTMTGTLTAPQFTATSQFSANGVTLNTSGSLTNGNAGGTIETNAYINIKPFQTNNFNVYYQTATAVAIAVNGNTGMVTLSSTTCSMGFYPKQNTGLPTSGYTAGCILYNVTNNRFYGSTETVTGTYSWQQLQ